MIRCPQCNWPLGDDERFCNQCGAEISNAQQPEDEALPQAEEANAAEKAGTGSVKKNRVEKDQPDWKQEVEQKVNAALEGAGKKDVTTDQHLVDKQIDRSIPKREDDTPKPGGKEKKAPAKKSKCKDLHVEYNTRRIFVDGYSMPFEFRITPLEDDIDDIRIRMKVRNQRTHDTFEDEVTHEFIPEKNRADELNMDFLPPEGLYGQLTFRFYIGYSKNAEQCWYLVKRTHNIIPRQEKVGNAVDSINIDLRNMIGKVGNAVDVNISQRMDKLKDVMQSLNPNDSASELANMELPSVWEPLPLKPCRSPAPQIKVQQQKPHQLKSASHAGARQRSLTIKYDDGKLLHLLAGNGLKMGKNRERNDIVARNFLPDLSDFDRDHCHMIGREHLVLERRRNECFLKDGVHGKPSKNGIYMDSERMSPAGEKRIPLNRSVDLGLAATTTDPNSFGLQIYAWQCKSETRRKCTLFDCPENSPACVVIKRHDNVPEIFLWLFTCCPLKQIDTRFGDALVWRQDDGFALWNNGRGSWLEPGKSLAVKEKAVCREYEQYGMGGK